jgi:hypothetical protein
VISYLEDLGEPDFAIDTYLDVQEETGWTAGYVLDGHPAIPEDEIWTVTLRGGMYRIEAGLRDSYFAEDEDYDDGEEFPADPVAAEASPSPGPVRAAASDRTAARRKTRRKAQRKARRRNH